MHTGNRQRELPHRQGKREGMAGAYPHTGHPHNLLHRLLRRGRRRNQDSPGSPAEGFPGILGKPGSNYRLPLGVVGPLGTHQEALGPAGRTPEAMADDRDSPGSPFWQSAAFGCMYKVNAP